MPIATNIVVYTRRWRDWDLEWQPDPDYPWARWPRWEHWAEEDRPQPLPSTPPPPEPTAQEASLGIMGFQVLGTCGGASVAVRRHLLRSSTVLWQHHDKRYAAILCRADFHKEVMGHASLVFGSLHINNVAAKKPVVSAELLAEFFEAATLHKADAVGWDANQTRLGWSRWRLATASSC